MAKSTFDTELEKALRLMNWERKPVNESLSSVEYYKMGADGKIYGIVKEGTKYYIKTTTQGNEKIRESYEYIGGINNKSKNAFSDYNKATKHLELKLMSLNEAYGQHVSTETTDPYKNQKVFESLTEEARKEIDRVHQIYENSCHIGQCNVGDPESKGKSTGEETTKNNEPFTEKANAELDKDPKFNGTVKNATNNKEVKGVEADLESDKMKKGNSGSDKDYKDAHDDLEGKGVADKKPAGGKTVKMNESCMEFAGEEPVDDLDADDFTEEPAEVDPLANLETEPIDGAVEDTTVGDDLVGIDDNADDNIDDSIDDDEEDLDTLLREFDEEFGSMDEPEEVDEESAIVGPNKVLDGPHGTDGKDAKWKRVEEGDGNVNEPAKEGGEATLDGPHGTLGVQSWDKMDKSVNEAFQFLSRQIYQNLKEEVNKKKSESRINESFGNTIERMIREELTKLDAWGKHPRYQKAPFKTPANKEVVAGTAEKDWNDDSAKGEEAYGKKIGNGAPFTDKVADLLADSIVKKFFGETDVKKK